MSPSRVSTNRYQHVLVKGTPFERGQQHGSQASTKIHFNISKYKSLPSMPSPDIVDRYVRDYYIPAITAEFPRGLEEMSGIAEGAKTSLEDIVMLNARYDLSRHVRNEQGPTECTSMSLVTKPADGEGGGVFVAQNWDISPWLQDNDTIIILHSIDPCSNNVSQPRSTIALTEAGQLGRSGMNSLGMAVCANSLWSSQDFFPAMNEASGKPVLPVSLSRRMILDCGNIGQALRTVSRMSRHTSNNLMIGCRSGITMDVELTPHDAFIIHPDTIDTVSGPLQLLTHANHFVSPAMLSRSDIKEGYGGGSSFYRDKRLYQRLAQSARASSGELGVKDIQHAFKDHAGLPESLCEHATSTSTSVTVACVVYDLSRLEMHVSTGNPCQGMWDTYKLDAKLEGK
ncbi:peptidase C45 acyl-coenzyme A:6-aminopenicillanic acid acyl-transferase [Akanthomyces lecanii RCEF 1005]|uniref:Peptidase C45 acyl-coenzyme A:6-aminopenicillanic acid acyl-transferase n=1 Tax=Akanthomyces lecanii RCEF 1005 TaxID=1081108 RepID=A0A168C2G4_CORDF|nr:peptidase C45 acyl-coenzyme A:6-aminopenicillanic acid acyl-transferase [Akanthomyces lecanii RCEF 1005]